MLGSIVEDMQKHLTEEMMGVPVQCRREMGMERELKNRKQLSIEHLAFMICNNLEVLFKGELFN